MKNYKIIQTQDYLLVVDENSKPEKGVHFYWHDPDGETHLIAFCIGVETSELRQYWQAKSNNEYGYGDWSEDYGVKILAHLPLNNSPVLEGVDLLPKLVKENYQEIANSILKDMPEGIVKSSALRGIVAGLKYKAATKTYSEGNLQGLIQVLLEAHTIGTTVFMKRKADEYIQSLNKPKLPVGFEAEYNKSPLEEMMPEMEGRLQFSQVKTIPNEQGIPVWQGTYVY